MQGSTTTPRGWTVAGRGTDLARLIEEQNRRLIELLAATGRGEKRAFARLYRLTSPKLYAVALRILKDESSAQDCLQDGFLSVWRQAANYQSQYAAPMTWLTTIIRNRAIDLLRKRAHDAFSVDAEYALANAQGPQEDQIDRLTVAKCLAELKPEQRDCVIRAYFEGLTHAELAEDMQVPLGTIKTWIRRGLQQLRQCLEK